MNRRIRELEDQCWEDVPVDIDYDYLSRVRRVFNREKFAQLIVRECARAYHQTRLSEVTIEQHFLTHLGLKNE